MKTDLLKQEIQAYLEPIVRDIFKIKISIIAVKSGCFVFASHIFGPSASAAGLDKIKVAEPASRDFVEIVERLSQASPLDAERFYRAIAEAALSVQMSPELGATGRLPNTKELHLREYSTTLVYDYEETGAVTVFGILHAGDNRL